MDFTLDKRTESFTKKLSEIEQGRVLKYLDLFRNYEFFLQPKYLKKLDVNLWELRPGDLRLLLGRTEDSIIVVHIFKKKTQKTPKKEIQIAKSRLKEYGRK